MFVVLSNEISRKWQAILKNGKKCESVLKEIVSKINTVFFFFWVQSVVLLSAAQVWNEVELKKASNKVLHTVSTL